MGISTKTDNTSGDNDETAPKKPAAKNAKKRAAGDDTATATKKARKSKAVKTETFEEDEAEVMAPTIPGALQDETN